LLVLRRHPERREEPLYFVVACLKRLLTPGTYLWVLREALSKSVKTK
jgi:hypothetical protein